MEALGLGTLVPSLLLCPLYFQSSGIHQHVDWVHIQPAAEGQGRHAHHLRTMLPGSCLHHFCTSHWPELGHWVTCSCWRYSLFGVAISPTIIQKYYYQKRGEKLNLGDKEQTLTP